MTRTYSNWIDYLFTHVPAVWNPRPLRHGRHRSTERAAARHVDPYALIRQDL